MDTKKLRQKILDLAIRGKLVPQDPNDEPASVLLERIRAEKERLIKEGKIKRGKKSADTPNDENEMPFEIPESWEWIKLSDIASFGGGKTPSMEEKKYWNGGTNLWITSKDMKSAIIADSMMKITDAALPLMTIYEPGTLLIVTRSGILRRMLPIAILDKKACVNQDLKAISLYLKTIHKYIYYVIKANEVFILKKCHKDGTTVDSINFEKFIDFQIPLPPLAEQQRIVSAIEQWFAEIDILENAKDDLQTSIAKAKSKILDLAIHGKLVPQDPNDEPAIELLKRINPELKPCDNADSPYKVPTGWEWCKLGNIGKWQSGATPSRMNKEYYNGNIPWLKTGDLNDGFIHHISESITEKALQETSVKLNPAGSVLIAMYGATIGKVGILTFSATTNQACCACIGYKCIEKMYLFYFLLSHKEQFIMLGGGGAQPNISKEKIVETLFPLPPLAEQQRIVAKIEELFAVLDNIKESIEV